jgi:hypothetical protein
LFIYFSNIVFFIYGTISKTVPLRQTEPAGNPAAAVGIFFMDRLFTKVAQFLSATMFEPDMNTQEQAPSELH